jgi:hypothetical protein
MRSAEPFLHAIISDREFADSFVAETCELAAILEENGLEEREAFRGAVRQKTDQFSQIVSGQFVAPPSHPATIANGAFLNP